MTEPPEWLGWFSSPEETTPAHDPGLDAPCPVCLRPLSPPMKTISMMAMERGKSWFYRVHKKCARDDALREIESAVIDAEAARRSAF